MNKAEVEDKGQRIFDALKADMKNRGEDVSPKAMLPATLGMEIAIAAVVAFFSIADSLVVLAKAERSKMGWKPGDEVFPDE